MDEKDAPPLSDGHESGQLQPFRFFDLPRELHDLCYDYMMGPTISLPTTRKREKYDDEVPDSDSEESDRNSEESDSDSEEYGSKGSIGKGSTGKGSDSKGSDSKGSDSKGSDSKGLDSGTVEVQDALKTFVSRPPLVNIPRVSQEMDFEYEQRAMKQMTLYFHDHSDAGNELFDPSNINFPHFACATRASYFLVAQCDGKHDYPEEIGCNAETLMARIWLQDTTYKLRNLKSVHGHIALQCAPAAGGCKWREDPNSAVVQASLQTIHRDRGCDAAGGIPCQLRNGHAA